MRIDEFRVGQHVTHSNWPGCVLQITSLVDDGLISALVIKTGRHYSGAKYNTLDRFTSADGVAKFGAFDCMSRCFPSRVQLPEGV